jgi:hypothetical protein
MKTEGGSSIEDLPLGRGLDIRKVFLALQVDYCERMKAAESLFIHSARVSGVSSYTFAA